MREPKFSDAWCYGKAFEQDSRVCRVCLANASCKRKFFKKLGARLPPASEFVSPAVTAAQARSVREAA